MWINYQPVSCSGALTIVPAYFNFVLDWSPLLCGRDCAILPLKITTTTITSASASWPVLDLRIVLMLLILQASGRDR